MPEGRLQAEEWQEALQAGQVHAHGGGDRLWQRRGLSRRVLRLCERDGAMRRGLRRDVWHRRDPQPGHMRLLPDQWSELHP